VTALDDLLRQSGARPLGPTQAEVLGSSGVHLEEYSLPMDSDVPSDGTFQFSA
jgi:hypothetical protein